MIPHSRPYDAPVRWGNRILWGIALVAALALFLEVCTGGHLL